MIKYIKSVLWRAAKRLSYIEDARCLKVNVCCKTDMRLGFPTRLPTSFFFFAFLIRRDNIKNSSHFVAFRCARTEYENLRKGVPIFVFDVVCVNCMSDIFILFLFERFRF